MHFRADHLLAARGLSKPPSVTKVIARWREGGFGNRRRLGGFRATNTVSKLTLRDCRDRAKPATKPLKRAQDCDDILFDGIVRGRD